MSRTAIARIVATGAVIASLGAVSITVAQQAPQPSTEHGTSWTADTGEWMPLPDIFPAGAHMKVIYGDPAKGPADFYFKFPAGFGVPWHFHTPVEKALVDQGTITFEMRDGKKMALGPGGYMRFPSRAVHKATCTSNTECLFYLVSNGPFDIHLVDENWKTTRSWRASDMPTTARK